MAKTEKKNVRKMQTFSNPGSELKNEVISLLIDLSDVIVLRGLRIRRVLST